MLKNLKRAAAIVLSFAMAIQFGLANSYYVNAEEEPVEPQQEQTTTVENNSEVQEEDANEVAVPETKSVELSYVAEDGTILQAATYRDFDLNYGLNTDSSVMLNFDGYTLKDVIVNNSQTVSADQASLSVTSDLVSVQFVYKKIVIETESQTTEPAKMEEKNEDDAEADPNPETEVKEELPEYPAFDQSEMAGNVVVHATAAEGVLPRDSKLVVKRITRKAILNAVEETVSEKNMEVESAVALDVTIQSKDGVEIQPNGFVNISFENVATTAQETNVYHVTNDASTVTEVATNAQSFDADHFSIYVITNENKVPLTTFNFVANGTTVSTQIVKSGDTLIAPTAPDMIGQAFVGWVDEAGNSFTGFGKQAEITETTTRTITARYEAALYVYFLNPDGSQIMRTEKVGDHEAHDFTAVSYEVDSTHKLVGWAAKKNGTENIADKITVPKGSTSVNVYAIIKEGYWVTFDSDGGSIVDSQFVLHGDNLVLDKSTTPTKPGYTFDGWYNGLTKVENGATVTSPMTLTAHWKAAKVSYTVIHWWENADDDGYSFHESQELQGLTGATTTAAAKSYTIKGKNIHGKDTSDKVFTATTIEQKTIKGDGSTIVNVYYKRKTYTMHFKERSYSRTDYTTITKKWGQSISKKEWPTYNGNGNWQISDSRYLAYTSTMPMNDSTLWSTSGYYTHKAYYYVRNIEDTNYELHHTDVIKSSSDYLTIGKEDCYAIAGFTYSYGDPGVDGYYNNSKFYYTRNSYKIKFINKGKVDKSVDKKYQQSISNENYTPTRPSSLLEYYVFDGWYENELCEGEAFDFSGKKMPAQNVTLYAKWTAKKISLKYNLNNPEGTVDKGTTKVAAGTIASTVLPSASAIEGYSFAGWYVADENGHMTNVAFNANDAILKDTNVIGKWLYNGELKVKYVADGVEAPKDNNVYAGGAKATVANGVTKEGKKFLGWQLDGNVYQPGQNFEVNKNLADDKNVITLTAVFGDSETSAILNYHPGNGNGEDQSVAILNNVEVALESTSNLHYSAPGEDYYFAGWATSMEDAQKGNAKYAVGDKVRVNADSSNDLYATWVKKTVIEVTANSNTLPYNGEEQKVEGFKVVTAGYEVTGLKAEAKGTNFGTYDTVITDTATVTKGGVDVTDKVIVNVTKGTLTISKRDVTLTSGSASRVYNKEALTNGEVTVSGDGFAKNEGATYTVTGSQTEVGESDNTFTYELKSNTKASNYNIEVKFGELKVTAQDGEVVVTITGHSDSVDYDGNEKSVSGYDVAITEGSKYTTDDFTFNGNAEAKGTEAGTYPMNLAADQFTNTNDNYKNVRFVVNDGSLTISPKSITPDGPDTPEDEKTGITVTDPIDSTYDGNEHINGLTVTDSKLNTTLVEGTDYTLTYSGDLINVGTVTITIKGIGNYTGEFTKTYQILPREYTVTTNTDSKVYDGNPLTAGGTVNNLVKDETVVFTITGSQTNVGTSDNTYELKFEGTAKAKNYTHGKDSIGTLTVTKKSIVPDGPDTPDEKKTGITVTDPEGSKYDGEEHKNKPKVEDTKTKATLKEGKDYELSYSEDVTNAGTVTVTVTGIGNYEGSFEVTYEITKRHVTLTSADAEKVYDGSALTNDTVTVGGDKFAKKEGATYNVTGNQTEVGSSENTFTYELKSNTTASNYNIEVKFGELKVTPFTDKVTVTIKGHEDTATYDGNPHSVEGYEVTNISNKLYKENDIGFTGEAKAEGTKAGTYQMNLTAQQFSNISQNFTNVEFVVEDGSLTINPKSITPDGPDTPDEKKTGITVTAPEDSKYDGEEHRNKPTVTDTKTKATLKEGTDYELSYSKDVINAGTVTVIVKGIGNYEGSFEVTYEITKRNVTLTSGSASKVYDKTALTNDTVTVSGEGFAKDEGATYKVTGSRTKVGTSKNTFTYELKSNTKASNYNIEVKFGELKVTAQDGEVVVTITGHSDSVDYDGNEKSVSGYDVAITEGSKYTTDDFTFNGNAEAKGTEAGTYPMNLAADQFTNTNDNYTQVTFIVNDGTLTINPKSITPDGPDTPKEEKTGITVTDPENSIYDGNEHINGLTVTDSKLNTTLVENTDYSLTYSGDLINVGTVTITIKGIGNYTGEFTKTYQILPREYTVTTNTDSKVYDGTALTAGGTVNNLVDGETVGFTMTGSQTNVGTSNNTYELNWTGSAKESNYKHGKDSIGTLTVTKQSIAPDPEHPETYKEVTITSPSDEVYDGKEHKWIPTVTDKEENELVAKTDYEVTYSTTDFTNVTGTITVTITGIGNYTGKATRTYSITPKTYTVTTESDSKVYDGTALTAGGKVSGIVKGETVDFTITGSQTSVGTSDNTYELDWTGSAKESNYKHSKDSIGTLTVKAKSIVPDGPDTPDEKKTGITVSDPSDSKYDGKEHREVLTVQDTKKNDELVAEKDYSVTYSDDLVNAGTVTITIEGIGNYTGSFTKTYEITKRSVTLTSATASKTYDGQALTSTSITVSGDGFVKGEGATYNVTGTQTEVGNSANSFEYKLNENTLASNYDITKVVGTLTVTRDTTPVTPAPTPTTPSVPPVVQRVVPTPTPVPEEKVEEEQTPKAEPKEEEKVEEDYTPKATQEYYWALINLICAIVTVLFGLLLLISKRHKDEDDEEEDDETKQQATTNEDEEQEQEKKRGLFTRVLAVLIAIVSVVFFLVTEDMSLAWTWTDQWTIWMVVIGLVQIVVFFVGRKWKNVDNDDDDEEAQQA